MTDLPDPGHYWTEGELITERALHREAYWTCMRCGAFVNSPDRHEDWHRLIEAIEGQA